jgi:hypothetical protein
MGLASACAKGEKSQSLEKIIAPGCFKTEGSGYGGNPDRCGAPLIVGQVNWRFVGSGEALLWKYGVRIARMFVMQVCRLCLGAMLSK